MKEGGGEGKNVRCRKTVEKGKSVDEDDESEKGKKEWKFRVTSSLLFLSMDKGIKRERGKEILWFSLHHLSTISLLTQCSSVCLCQKGTEEKRVHVMWHGMKESPEFLASRLFLFLQFIPMLFIHSDDHGEGDQIERIYSTSPGTPFTLTDQDWGAVNHDFQPLQQCHCSLCDRLQVRWKREHLRIQWEARKLDDKGERQRQRKCFSLWYFMFEKRIGVEEIWSNLW